MPRELKEVKYSKELFQEFNTVNHFKEINCLKTLQVKADAN